MQASELLSTDLPVLSPKDTVQRAVSVFLDTSVSHIPIVENGIVQGVLPTDVLSGIAEIDLPLGDFREDYIQAYAFRDQHMLDVFELIAKMGLTAIPVVDEQRAYLGSITTEAILSRLSNFYSFRQIGGIIVLRMGVRDYNLNEISQIVVGNNGRIIMLYLDMDEATESYLLTLKLDTLNLVPILATFDRYKYNVVYYQPSGVEKEELRDRYELLMKLFDI
jgi:predicted transcriptional regulator